MWGNNFNEITDPKELVPSLVLIVLSFKFKEQYTVHGGNSQRADEVKRRESQPERHVPLAREQAPIEDGFLEAPLTGN